jgi:hypothetical protein
LERPKSLNPNWALTASYNQTLYEKTIPPLHVLARAVWQLVSPGFNRVPGCQPDGTDGSNSSDSGNLVGSASVNTNRSTWCDVWFRFIRSRRQDSPEVGEKAGTQAWDYHRYR